MKQMTLLALLLGVLVNCSTDEKEDTYDSVSCTAAIDNVISIGTNVTVDFNVNNVNVNATITSSNCAGFTQGPAGTFQADAQRTGNNLTLDDNNGGVINTTISGTTLAQTT